MPRGLAFFQGMLVVADAKIKAQSLVVFGNCSGLQGRPYLGRIRPFGIHERIFNHPYAVVSRSDMIYVSSQDGAALIAVNMSSGVMKVVEQVSKPQVGTATHTGPLRGMDIDARGCFHVANRHKNALEHICNDEVWHTKVDTPIDVKVDPLDDTSLYVGSFSSNSPGVLAFSLSDSLNKPLQLKRTFSHPRIKHPAGLSLWDGKLYVLEQSHRSLEVFDIHTGSFLGTLIDKLPDVPEQLLISNHSC